jgi:integrase
MPELVRARRPENLPVVSSRNEAHRLLRAMSGTTRLMAVLLYRGVTPWRWAAPFGMLRLSECCALRVKDIDLIANKSAFVAAKGGRIE